MRARTARASASKSIFNDKTYRSVFIVFVVICIIVAISCFQYYKELQTVINEEGSSYLQEISSRCGENINQIVNYNFAALNSTAAIFKTQGADSFKKIDNIVAAQKDFWKYKDILLIAEDGNAYNSSGKRVVLNNDTYFEKTVVNKKYSISTEQMIDNKERTMFAIPFDEMVVEGKQMMAIASVYSAEAFDNMLLVSTFDGNAYSCIVNRSGVMVLRSSKAKDISTGYNIITTLSEAEIRNGITVDDVKSDFRDDKRGQIRFEHNGTSSYMMYTPIVIEDWFLLTLVPESVVSAKSNMFLRLTLLLCGLIAMSFAVLIAFLTYSSFRSKRKLENIAFVDNVTNGNTIQKFYLMAQDALAVPDHPKYALIYTNIQKFKVINEQFGRTIGDAMLRAFYESVKAEIKNNECVGRIYADNFCILLECDSENALLERLNSWYKYAEEYVISAKPTWALPVNEFGAYIIDNDEIPFTQMMDRAKLSLRENSKSLNSKITYSMYTDEVRKKLFREKHLEDMMDEAMANGEFKLFLQPKYCVSDEKIGGAEALTRWISNSEGMIYPDEFIPLFEKNGFIIKLDLWIFEEVCRWMRHWIDEGNNPVKISVNCSRINLRNPQFLKPYEEIAAKYNVPRELLEIELTESVVMEDVEGLTRIIDDIHGLGFGCSMDDFGSGYSSLNLIQSIPVDTLKIDKIFFHNNVGDSERMESVVGGIVGIAKALNLTTIAEGVEYREQVDMLKRVGCDYIQGYIFAKPMTVDDFSKLAFNKN